MILELATRRVANCDSILFILHNAMRSLMQHRFKKTLCILKEIFFLLSKAVRLLFTKTNFYTAIREIAGHCH